MATNAPYYQMRASQLSTGNSNSNAIVQHSISHDGGFASTTATATATAMPDSSQSQHVPSYTERTTRQTGADTQQSTFDENHNLVELLEAATTAADQSSMSLEETMPVVPVSQLKSKRKRGTSPPMDTPIVGLSSQGSEILTAKRRRVDTSTNPSLRTNENDSTICSSTSPTNPSPPRDAFSENTHAAGVHSAAALFRRTSSLTTRKYTRPPMSKLFMSLNISPENFIALQALAKAYMLSPEHPERQSCVGNRGKGDTDMVKLRLFNCVRDFLADGGVGEKFFGEHVEKPGEKESSEAARALGETQEGREKMVWPRDGNKIIGLVTPLMRRMVTNERQRLYAIDTRKGGRKAEKEGSEEAVAHEESPARGDDHHHHAALDPTLERPLPPTTIPPTTSITTAAQTSPPNIVSHDPRLPVLPSSPSFLAPLSTDAAEPHLTHISIFLTYSPTMNPKQSIKLDEKRISTTRPAHLTFYNYTAFVEQINSMITLVQKTHRSLFENIPTDDLSHNTSLKDTDNLRGLAVAANALHSPTIDPVTSHNGHTTPPDVPIAPKSAEPKSAQYTVKTIGPTGWQVIDNAETWYHVLTERAFATWADGVCNIIVELHKAKTGTGKGGLRGEDVGLDREVQMEDV